jgi:competence protein ComEC
MLRTGTVAFLGGIVLLQQLSQLPAVWLLLGAVLLALPAWLAPYIWSKVVCCFLAGFVWAGVNAHWQLSKQLLPGDIRKDIQVIGHITSLPQYAETRVRFDFQIKEILTSDTQLARQKIKISWYNFTGTDLNAGDKWQLTIRLKPARNFFNPGAFDYSGYLLQQDILATGYVRRHSENRLLASSQLDYPLQRMRQTIRNIMAAQLSSHKMEPVLRGLVIGDRSDMDKQSWSMLRDTGTVHLLAISGLHIGLVTGLGFIVFRRTWSLSAIACRWLAAPRAAAVFAGFVALAYAGLAGFSIPTQRALIMAFVILLATFTQRQVKATNVLCLALLFILLVDPFAILSTGFWLSFSAVAIIYYLLITARLHQLRWYGWIRIQVLISLLLIPLLLYFFQQAPGLSPLANIVAVPVVSIIIVPIALAGVFIMSIHIQAGVWLLQIAADVLAWLWDFLNWLATFKTSIIILPIDNILVVMMATFGLLLLLLPKALPGRWLAVFFFLPLVFPAVDKPQQGEVFLSVLDVGQGLSTVVQTRQHALVFDTGPRYSANLDAADAVIHPFLVNKRITHIDALVVSHGDNDHIGGAETLLGKYPVKQLYTSVEAPLKKHRPVTCMAGQTWQWDDVQFEILHPANGDYASGLNENNLSCVLSIKTRHQRVLLTGDIEKQAESLLASRYGDLLKSDVMVVPHHGSKTSSTSQFLKLVQPQIAIIPVGWLNRFRLPSSTVITRYEQLAGDVYTTSRDGALLLATGKQLDIVSYRTFNRRYWHYHQPENDASRYAISLLK